MSGKVVALLMAVLMVAGQETEGAITCNQVYNALQPCLSYITSGGTVPSKCCSGVSGILGTAKTTLDRRTTCSCLKQLAGSATGPMVAAAAAIPRQCGIPIPYKISPSTDCNKVN